MNSFDFLLALGHADQNIVQEAIELMDTGKNNVMYGRGKAGRTLLVAAIVSALVAAMCVSAYALNLFGIRELLMPVGDIADAGEGGWYATDAKILSAQGLYDSPEYLACQEFKSFHDDYKVNNYYGDAVPQEPDQWMEAHMNIYFCYTQTLKEKILEICNDHGLKLRDSRYDNIGLDRLETYVGIENILSLDGYQNDGCEFMAYNDGSFRLQGGIDDEEVGYIDTDMTRSVKGYFSHNIVYFDTEARISERSYTTENGCDIIIVDNGGGHTVLFYNGEAAFVAMNLYSEEPLIAEKLTAFAEKINFKALGVSSLVNEGAKQPYPTQPPATEDELERAWGYITDGYRELGESFRNAYTMQALEIRVDGLTISDNIYDAGWSTDEFDEYSYVMVCDSKTGEEKMYSYPDYLDGTGNMPEGLRLLTVDISVTNTNSADADVGAGTNLFPNCLLHLLYAPNAVEGSGDYTDNIACSAAHPEGRSSVMYLAPGESMSYRLASALDDHFAGELSLNGLYLSTMGQVVPEGIYIPVKLAEQRTGA